MRVFGRERCCVGPRLCFGRAWSGRWFLRNAQEGQLRQTGRGWSGWQCWRAAGRSSDWREGGGWGEVEISLISGKLKLLDRRFSNEEQLFRALLEAELVRALWLPLLSASTPPRTFPIRSSPASPPRLRIAWGQPDEHARPAGYSATLSIRAWVCSRNEGSRGCGRPDAFSAQTGEPWSNAPTVHACSIPEWP